MAGIGNNDANIITQIDVILVLKKILDVRMLQWNHLAHISIYRDLAGLISQKHGCRCKQQQNDRPN